MKLYDELHILDGMTMNVLDTIPAYVGHARSDGDWELIGRDYVWVIDENLLVLTRPDPRLVVRTRYLWHGNTYTQTGRPKIRSIKGREHHYTLTLEATA